LSLRTPVIAVVTVSIVARGTNQLALEAISR
jgi:hypothetical protein